MGVEGMGTVTTLLLCSGCITAVCDGVVDLGLGGCTQGAWV